MDPNTLPTPSRSLREGALPAIVMLHPVFPGQIVDLELSWDWERDAVEASRQTDGLIALVPQWIDIEHTKLLADAGDLTATGAQVIGRSMSGTTVRVQAMMRLRVTELDMPPDLPCVDGEPMETEDEGGLQSRLDRIRRLTRRHLAEEGIPEPFNLWLAGPGEFADLVAPFLFQTGSADLRNAYVACTDSRLEMIWGELLRRQASLRGQRATARATAPAPPPPSKTDQVVASVMARFQGVTLEPELRTAFEERVRAATTDVDTERRDIHYLERLPLGRFSSTVSDAGAVRQAFLRELGALDEATNWVLDRLPALAGSATGTRAPIGRPLLMVAPPGVGKTRRAEVIARAIGRPHYTIPGASISDALSVSGLRGLYGQAQPGMIISALIETQVMDPVVIIDEVDKMGSSNHGSPANALLALLEPQQATAFRDGFIAMDLDVSRILFILTANDLDAVPRPLRDRCHVLRVNPYTVEQRRHILERVTLPQLLEEHGISGNLALTPEAIELLVSRHEHEAGIRGLIDDLRVLVLMAGQRRSGRRASRITARDVEQTLAPLTREDVDRCVICGSDIEDPGAHLRIPVSQVPLSGSVAAVPVAVHRGCLGMPTHFFLSNANQIRARVAAEVVIWTWMLRSTPDDPSIGGDPALSPQR
jgi:MoxR-like ATPase